MKISWLVLSLALLPSTALAGEKVAGTNYYVTEALTVPFDETSGYWRVDFSGVGEVTEGPLETSAVTCHGAGYWDEKGPYGDGVCIFGVGEDTFIWRFEAKQGSKANRWAIVGATGKYAGITGSGTATTQRLPGKRRITHWEGEIELPE